MLVLAAVSDYKNGRISNRLILTGLCLGFFYRFYEDGLRGILIFLFHAAVPVIIFFVLFLMRVLGAGDIKLFSIISCICSWREWVICVVAAFVAGAVEAVIRMIRLGNLRLRIFSFSVYIHTILEERKFSPYPYGAKEKENTICFSGAIAMGYLISLGVCG